VLGTFSVATACLIVISGHSLLQLLYSSLTGGSSLSYSGVLLDDNSDAYSLYSHVHCLSYWMPCWEGRSTTSCRWRRWFGCFFSSSLLWGPPGTWVATRYVIGSTNRVAGSWLVYNNDHQPGCIAPNCKAIKSGKILQTWQLIRLVFLWLII
jgi:hypothetical protein